MEALVDGGKVLEGEREGFDERECKAGNLNGAEESEEICSSSDNFLASEVNLNDEHSSCEGSSSLISQPATKINLEKQGSSLSECEMMRERFAKLLLGEDMSGCGNGVCTALAIANAITNLCATLFGQVWRLEPLKHEKKLMWKREMEWLLSVSDHIVELTPSWQTFPDGTKLEVMTCRPRSDLYINLPALRKLDNMLLEILDSFEHSEFWYVDRGIVTSDTEGLSIYQRPLPCQEEKWWLPVPRVPTGGLTENTRKMLQHRRDSTNQILKAAMAINSATLAEMAVPSSYLEALPKNGKTSLGDLIHRYISSDQFLPECLLDCLDLTSDHHALEIANRVEATIHVWRRRNCSKPAHGMNRAGSKSSWEIVKDLVSDVDKREQLADRAESLLACLKQRFPGLPQTTLDMSKIQLNKDVGKSILESYSRVLESLAFNIVARIDDLLYVDDISKHSDHFMPFSKLISSARGARSPYVENSKHSVHGFGFKRIFTDYLSVDGKGKELRRNTWSLDSFSSTTRGEMSASPSVESSGGSKDIISPRTDETGEDDE